jgi:hypothetical protein
MLTATKCLLRATYWHTSCVLIVIVAICLRNPAEAEGWVGLGVVLVGCAGGVVGAACCLV